MSCWVVPAIAAELWGISVQQVLERARLGEVVTKHDLDLMFVDVAPASPRINTGLRPPASKVTTYISPALADDLTLDELEALGTGGAPVEDAEELQCMREDRPLNWRAARRAASKLRRAPGRTRAA